MHIEIAQCADFVWRSMVIVDIAGFRPAFFMCTTCTLQKNRKERSLMLAPNINIIPVVIVKAPAASSRSIKLESEPAKKPDAIMSYSIGFSNKKHIGFHIAINENGQAYDVYALGTDKLGKWEARWYNKHPEKLVKLINTEGELPDGVKVTKASLR